MNTKIKSFRDYLYNKFWKWGLISCKVYCKLCKSCGEEGCCSPISCAYNCMVKYKPRKCMYGERYFNSLKLSYILYEETLELMDKLENNVIDKDTFFKKHKEFFNLKEKSPEFIHGVKPKG